MPGDTADAQAAAPDGLPPAAWQEALDRQTQEVNDHRRPMGGRPLESCGMALCGVRTVSRIRSDGVSSTPPRHANISDGVMRAMRNDSWRSADLRTRSLALSLDDPYHQADNHHDKQDRPPYAAVPTHPAAPAPHATIHHASVLRRRDTGG